MSVEKRRRTINFKGDDETATSSPPPDDAQLLRSSWELAALWQFLYMFSDVLKIPRCDSTDQLIFELVNPNNAKLLPDLQLSLLKNISSQRGLTIGQFEDYTRRQYIAKDAELNPFGEEIEPKKFVNLSPSSRCKVLYQLCRWILYNTERFREKNGHPKDIEQMEWRVDPMGWDAKGNTYYALDNNWLYCRIEPPISSIPSKKSKAKARRKNGRGTKRRKSTVTNGDHDVDDNEDDDEEVVTDVKIKEEPGPLDKMEWKCVCSNLEDYRNLVTKLENSRNLDEKDLHQTILEDIIPIFEKEEQKRERKLLEQEKEAARQALLANRKRSSRIDEKLARQQEQQEREAEVKRLQAELEREGREQQRFQQEEADRLHRLHRREERLEIREARRKLLNVIAVESAEQSAGSSGSERRSSRQSTRRRDRQTTDAEDDNEDDWMFDCVCGVHGTNYDDGTHSIACDECGIWQHTKCLGIIPNGEEDTEYVCDRCRNKKVQRHHEEEKCLDVQDMPDQAPINGELSTVINDGATDSVVTGHTIHKDNETIKQIHEPNGVSQTDESQIEPQSMEVDTSITKMDIDVKVSTQQPLKPSEEHSHLGLITNSSTA